MSTDSARDDAGFAGAARLSVRLARRPAMKMHGYILPTFIRM